MTAVPSAMVFTLGRTGADERHVAFKNIEELGNFVEGGLTHEVAPFGNERLLGVDRNVRRSNLRGVDAHRTEFVEHELFLVEPDAGLSKENRPFGRAPGADRANQ